VQVGLELRVHDHAGGVVQQEVRSNWMSALQGTRPDGFPGRWRPGRLATVFERPLVTITNAILKSGVPWRISSAA
jgi:hypothetical protein